MSGAGRYRRGGVRGDGLARLLALGPLGDQVWGAVLPVDVLKLLNLGPAGGKGGHGSDVRASELPSGLGASHTSARGWPSQTRSRPQPTFQTPPQNPSVLCPVTCHPGPQTPRTPHPERHSGLVPPAWLGPQAAVCSGPGTCPRPTDAHPRSARGPRATRREGPAEADAPTFFRTSDMTPMRVSTCCLDRPSRGTPSAKVSAPSAPGSHRCRMKRDT